MKLLLINPKFPESFWSFKWATENVTAGVRTVNPPLGLATLAALCPADWDVEIVDENVESIPLDPQADIIGVCGMGVQFERQTELLTYYRRKGYFIVAGGSYASLCPEDYETLADTVVAGEAEYIWQEFCRDFETGSPRKLYQETGTVALTDSPTPRFDLLKTNRYSAVSLQFSRGCPFRCEFCDIIVMFGRHPRTKSVEQIGLELDELRRLNVHHVFFVDDNLIGNKQAAKQLLAFLKDYQREHDYRFYFGTEVSLNIAYDKELLELFREANFDWVFIGIESPDEASLKETKKFQNTRGDILSSVRTIYANGIDVSAGFIIGFDNDTVDTFEQQYRFIVESGIQSAMIGLLVAVPKTPLYQRLAEENRLVLNTRTSDNSKLATNVIPKGMSYEEMVKGYRHLHNRLLEHRAIAARIRNKKGHFAASSYDNVHSFADGVRLVSKVIHRLAKQGGVSGVYHFVRSLPFLRPKLLPLVIRDWVIGLSMRDYVERHFQVEFEQERVIARGHLDHIKAALGRYLNQGSLVVTLQEMKNANPRFSFSIKGRLGRDFFVHSADQLERMLRNTRSSLTLRIEEFHKADLHLLYDMLEKLRRYGDRIVIAADQKSRQVIKIDSSVFNLMME
jgi:radical SAM superfamily enzyme YgiQ (UPF0313 family)